MRFGISWAAESKDFSDALRLLAVLSLNGSMRPANTDSFNGKYSKHFILFSKYSSFFGTSRALAPDFPDTSISRTEHELVVSEILRVSD